MANNEWATPAKFIESARKVMGSIDVDPASNNEAQKRSTQHGFIPKNKMG